MGLAIVMVVFHHLTIRCYDGVIGHLYGFLRLNGAIGVDIFLFVSAIGLVVSWQKNKNILQFYNRRIKRILPTYFILCTPIYIYIYRESITEGYWTDFISALLLINYWTLGKGYWYIAAILVLYFMFPLFYKVINKYTLNGLIFLLIIWVGVCFFIHINNPVLFKNIDAFLPRIPVFLFGIFLAPYVMYKRNLNINKLYLMPVLLSCVLLEGYFALQGAEVAYSFLPRLVYFPLSIVLMIYLIALINKIGEIRFSFLNYLGRLTLEIYLLNQVLINIGEKIFGSILGNLIGVLFTIIIAEITNKMMKIFR